MKFDSDFQDKINQIMDDPNSVPKADKDFTRDVFDDNHFNVKLAIPKDGDGPERTRVTRRVRNKDGLPIGTAIDNPIFGTRMYEVEYPDGHKATLAANAIAKNMFTQSRR